MLIDLPHVLELLSWYNFSDSQALIDHQMHSESKIDSRL